MSEIFDEAENSSAQSIPYFHSVLSVLASLKIIKRRRHMKQCRIFWVAFIVCVISSWSLFAHATHDNIQSNQQFRQDVMHFVRDVAAHTKNLKKEQRALNKRWLYESDDMGTYLIHWAVNVSIYAKGHRIGEASACEPKLAQTLAKATLKALKTLPSSLSWKEIQFKITFYYPPNDHQYIMVNAGDKAFELIGNVVPVRKMDTSFVYQRIQSEKAYLLRMMNPQAHAFFKRYNAGSGKREKKLRTIYTASSLYTLLKVQQVMPDPAIVAQIEPIAAFLLMMQEQQGKNAGAFHYDYDPKTQIKDKHFGSGRFIVGTTSKTIFTLLMLYDYTKNSRYLDSAKKAGNWLLTKIDTQGHVNPVSIHYKNKMVIKTKQSFLYSGQVLSALSRLYAVTKESSYYDAATHIANRMVAYIQKQGAFVGDDYRRPNSVSTSWVVMSLLDYAKINPAPLYRQMITRSAGALVNHQINTDQDVYNDGRLMDIMTSSGNGWVNEVMTTLYPFCLAKKMPGCEAYRDYSIASSRWLVQNVYVPANSFNLQDPKMAEGGVIRNFAENSVRTDAVCHGLNSLIGLLAIVGPRDQVLRVIPDTPIDEMMTLLQIGSLPA